MSRTWKIVLLILAFNVVCVLAVCAVLFVWLPALSTTSTREPTREEWAQSPRGDGTYVIGNTAEMALGTWHTDSNKYGCKWGIYFGKPGGSFPAVKRGSEKTVSVRGFSHHYFKTEGCGTWYYQD